MNKLEESRIIAPNSKEDTCAKFTIDSQNITFTIKEPLFKNREYVLQFWIKSDHPSSINVVNCNIETTNEWKYFSHVFTPISDDIVIVFENPNTYYIYNTKLELGNKSTDWSPAPEDVQADIQVEANKVRTEYKAAIDVKEREILSTVSEVRTKAEGADYNASEANKAIEIAKTQIKQNSDAISNLVSSGERESILTQTPNGWEFNMSKINDGLSYATGTANSASNTANQAYGKATELNNVVNEVSKKTSYINIKQDDAGKPLIELGDQNSPFKLRITNTTIDFMEGTNRVAYISNQKLYIQSSVVTDQMQIGDDGFGFVWKRRNNGNMGLQMSKKS